MKCNRRKFALASGGLLAAGVSGRFAAVSAQDAVPLIVYGDTVQGTKNIPDDQKAAKGCVQTNRFPRNAEIVWRFRVIDPTTGQTMDDTTLDKVEVKLGDGQVLAMKFGGHPKEPRDFYWTTPLVVPKDYPTGTLTYVVDATGKDGRTGEFKPFDIASSLLTITEEVLEDQPTPVPTPA
jgi:hypothetical protein